MGDKGSAEDFALRHFGGCSKHAEEARAVFRAIESLHPGLRELDPDAALHDVLGDLAIEDDSLDALEIEIVLLGPASHLSTWDPTTIGARSARGVIDERVRLTAGSCSCAARPVA